MASTPISTPIDELGCHWANPGLGLKWLCKTPKLSEWICRPGRWPRSRRGLARSTRNLPEQRLNRMNIGLVGCGRWGRFILRDPLSLGVSVSVVARGDDARLAEDAGAQVVARLDGLPAVDGIVVATPTTTHADVTEALCRAGRRSIARSRSVTMPTGRAAWRRPGAGVSLSWTSGAITWVCWRSRTLHAPANSESGRGPAHCAGRLRAFVSRHGLHLDLAAAQCGDRAGDFWQIAAARCRGGRPRRQGHHGPDGDVAGCRRAVAHCRGWHAVAGALAHHHIVMPRRCCNFGGCLRDHLVIIANPPWDDAESKPRIARRALKVEMPLLAELTALIGLLNGGPPPKGAAEEAAEMVATIVQLRRLAVI